MNAMDQYNAKKRTAEKAVQVVRSGDWVEYTFGHGIPQALDRALAARQSELRDVKIRWMLALRPLAVVTADPGNEAFTFMCWHFSGLDRRLCDQGLVHYIPLLYRNKPRHYRQSLEVDVCMLATPPMDKHGYFNFSLFNSSTRAMVEKARTVIVEVNEKLPVCLGGREENVHISEVDFVVEGESPDLVELPRLAPTEVDKTIARLIVEQMSDGSTIQFGIGGMPDTIGRMLCDSDLKDLGMHTEMLVDAFLDLFEAGKLTNRCKSIDRGKGAFSFAVGGKGSVRVGRPQPRPGLLPGRLHQRPGRDRRQRQRGGHQQLRRGGPVRPDQLGVVGPAPDQRYGGQLDFTTGAYMSRGGKAFVCMSSTYTDKKTGEMRSRVVPTLEVGSIVTGPRSQSPYIVTEYGIANLHGRSTWERAERVIEIAHPQFREELIREAQRMGVWRRSNKAEPATTSGIE